MKLAIFPSARADIRDQAEYYFDLELPEIGDRFLIAVNNAVAAACRTPKAGAPKQVRNPQLAGLRSWPIAGFPELRIYYLVQDDVVIVVRVPHDKRDIGVILNQQSLENPEPN